MRSLKFLTEVISFVDTLLLSCRESSRTRRHSTKILMTITNQLNLTCLQLADRERSKRGVVELSERTKDGEGA